MSRRSTDRAPLDRWWLFTLLALAAWTALAASIDNGHLGLFHDDGLYLASARSLRDGRGFGLPGRPGEPPPKYPIGLPMTVALVLKVDRMISGPPATGADDPEAGLAREVALARGVVIVGAWGFFLGIWGWLARLGVRPGIRAGVVLATAFHHVALIGDASTLFADLPFAAVAYALLYRWARPRNPSDAPRPWHAWAFDGALAGYGVLLRSNGVTLVFALAVAAWAMGGRGARRIGAGLVGLGVAGLVAVPASAYAGLRPRVVPSNSYWLEMKAGWTSPGAGLRLVLEHLRSAAFDFAAHALATPADYLDAPRKALADAPWASVGLRATFAAVVGFGLVRLARRTRPDDLPAWAHAAGSVAILAVWPWSNVMDRFLLSLIPMVGLAWAAGAEGVSRRLGLGPGRARAIAGLAIGLAALGNAAVSARGVQVFHRSGGQWPGAQSRSGLSEAFALVRGRTEPDAVVAFGWPELVWLKTGRTSVPLFEDEMFLTRKFGDADRLGRWRALVAGRAFYVLDRAPPGDPEGVDRAQVADLLRRLGPGWRLDRVGETSGGLYRLSRLVEVPPSG